ncbi:MAG: DHH family phosphoesterase [Clostridia bacterium]|nr:DHH family phosphoesterase [Clostridia bacterium]
MKRTYVNVTRKYFIAAITTSVLLLVCAVIALVWNKYIAVFVGAVPAIVALVYLTVVTRTRKKNIIKFLHHITGDDIDMSENLITSVPMPLAVCSIDGVIRWYNDRFENIFTGKKLPDESIEECIVSLKWSDVLKFPEGRQTMEIIGDNIYSVNWRIMKDRIKPNESGDHYSVFFYLKDITRECNLVRKYENERVDIATVNIDNFDEFMQKVDDETAEIAASKVRTSIVNWAKSVNAVFKRLDRDKYFVAFEHQNMEKCIADNFSIIENVMKIAEEVKFPISISIGIGTGGSITENEVSARHALDLALGRGGGQVCIKYDNEFKFYGGRNVEYERSTRVKARSVATALTDLIKNSDNVILAGHTSADYDCFGAAVGLARAVRELGKNPYIIHERISPAIENMYEEVRNVPEYDGMFVDEIEVFEEITADTLLIVIDTHRPSMLPSARLLERVDKVVVIDHHRRSTEFISPCSLVYHEPYASSACEMVTELLEYMNIGNAMTKVEAQCLYTGILMDTKNFMLKTGVRTFEAASFLRRMGLDTVAVRRMFSSELGEFTKKAEIVGASELSGEDFAISRTYEMHPNMRVIASQAADEMLNLRKVKASAVVFPVEGGVGISARSLGTVNVQLIMESIGGGGHMTVAGATIMDIDVDEGVQRVKNAIAEHLNERKG